MSPADLARELPVAVSFLRAYAQAVGAYGLAQVTGPVTNADGTVDAQVRVNVEGHDIDTVLDGMEHVYWQLMRSHRILESWWLRLGAQFEREGEVWRNYALDLFEGRETVIVNDTLEALEAAETWEGLRDMIFNVTNAYQSPHPETGLLRPEYRVTHIIVRIHRGSEPPLY